MRCVYRVRKCIKKDGEPSFFVGLLLLLAGVIQLRGRVLH